MLLVVEDNPQFSLVLGKMLERLGQRCEIVDTGEEALRRVMTDGEKYRLVLLDISLPGISGVEVARGIRALADKEKADVPILVMSPTMPDIPIEEMAQLRFAGLLAKAFFRDDLRAALERYARPVVEGARPRALPR